MMQIAIVDAPENIEDALGEEEQNIEAAESKLQEAHNLSNEGKHEDAIMYCEEALKLGIQGLGNDMHFQLWCFYFGYADIILNKLTQSGELFGEEIKEAIEKKAKEADEDLKKNPLSKAEIAQAKKEETKRKEVERKEDEDNEDEKEEDNEDEEDKESASKHSSQNSNGEEEVKEEDSEKEVEASDEEKEEEEKKEEKEEKEEDSVPDDQQIIWENIETARIIVETENDALKADGKDTTEICQIRAKIHTRLADFYLLQEKQEDAAGEHEKAVQFLLEAKEDQIALGKAYISMGSAYLTQEGSEQQATVEFLKAKGLFEKKLTGMINKEYRESEDTDREWLENIVQDAPEIKELKVLINQTYDKIEDAIAQAKELPSVHEKIKKVMEELSKAASEAKEDEEDEEEEAKESVAKSSTKRSRTPKKSTPAKSSVKKNGVGKRKHKVMIEDHGIDEEEEEEGSPPKKKPKVKKPAKKAKK